jgi:hypothetical protein
VEQSSIEAVEAALRMGYNLPPFRIAQQFGTLHPENPYGGSDMSLAAGNHLKETRPDALSCVSMSARNSVDRVSAF